MRSGISTNYRKCPRHGIPLDFEIKDGSELLTNLSWWCGECRGVWSELYFTMLEEARLPVMGLVRKFQIDCPSCSSLCTSRSCNFSCCDYHYCRDCKEHFDIEYEVLAQTALSREKITLLKSKSWLDEDGDIATRNEDRFEHHELSLTAPICEEHPDTPVSLAIDVQATDERYRFGWFCRDCDMVMFDYMHPHPGRSRTFFTLTDQPDFRCRTCHHCEFDQSADLKEARCITCGTLYRLKVVDAPNLGPS